MIAEQTLAPLIERRYSPAPMFVDRYTIECQAGDGGHGIVSFRREAHDEWGERLLCNHPREAFTRNKGCVADNQPAESPGPENRTARGSRCET